MHILPCNQTNSNFGHRFPSPCQKKNTEERMLDYLENHFDLNEYRSFMQNYMRHYEQTREQEKYCKEIAANLNKKRDILTACGGDLANRTEDEAKSAIQYLQNICYYGF